jgi:hypothetical protein
MKFSTRLSVYFGTSALALFSALGWLQLKSEQADLMGVEAREANLLGRSLQVSFE